MAGQPPPPAVWPKLFVDQEPPWPMLSPEDEAELHKKRLLNHEEKHFKRLTGRIRQTWTLAEEMKAAQREPKPAEEEAAAIAARDDRFKGHRQRVDILKEDFALDFSSFNNSIARLQFLYDANVNERERYAKEKTNIEKQIEEAKARNAQLRQQRDEAQARLAQRKKFDELAEAITRDKDARPRDETSADMAKLEEECRELKLESANLSETWKERRDQFGRFMDEGRRLRQLIRDDKEEVERREGMNEDDSGAGGTAEDEDVSRGGQTPKHVPNGNAHSGGRTPAHDTQDDGSGGLKPLSGRFGNLSRGGSAAPSRDVSPSRRDRGIDDDIEEGEDVEMGDVVRPSNTPNITINETAGNEDRMDVEN